MAQSGHNSTLNPTSQRIPVRSATVKEQRSLKLGAKLILITCPQGSCAPGEDQSQPRHLGSRAKCGLQGPLPTVELCSQEGLHQGAIVHCSNFLGLSLFLLAAMFQLRKQLSRTFLLSSGSFPCLVPSPCLTPGAWKGGQNTGNSRQLRSQPSYFLHKSHHQL